ncbi:MAG: ATP phosphoribosyltransferase regulatory subunit, partial [Methyloligellaceae bacterium]
RRRGIDRSGANGHRPATRLKRVGPRDILMPVESAQRFEALRAQAAALMDVFTSAGYEPVAPSIIQPADIFLDSVGEAIRGRTYMFTDPDGEELCLRPDLTVPCSRIYLSRHPDAGSRARFCYNGPAFRFQPSDAGAARPREFRQAGIENFGASDREKAEAEILSLVISALRHAGLTDVTLKLGDLGLFLALLDALELPERWRVRLKHHFWRPDMFHELLMRLCAGDAAVVPSKLRSVLLKLDVNDTLAAKNAIASFLREKDIPLIGARSLKEITERLLDHAADLRAEPLNRETADLIESYLAISGPPKAAGARIADLTRAADIDLSTSLQAYTKRLDHFGQAKIDLAASQFSAEFGRNLEYYTGFVFQLEISDFGPAGQIAGGGRYDGLLEDIGSPRNVGAVGSAIHTERLLAAVQGGDAS